MLTAELMAFTPEDISMFEDELAQYGIPGTPRKMYGEKQVTPVIESLSSPGSSHSDDTLDAVDDTWRSDPEWLPTPIQTVDNYDRSYETPADGPTPAKRAKPSGLSEEDKKERRKNLNRLAAQRCRRKRRSRADELEQEADELVVKNAELKKKLEELTEEKESLYDIIKVHFQSCHGEQAK